eukprot:jgi/Mesen1/5300/ME000264S04327
MVEIAKDIEIVWQGDQHPSALSSFFLVNVRRHQSDLCCKVRLEASKHGQNFLTYDSEMAGPPPGPPPKPSPDLVRWPYSYEAPVNATEEMAWSVFIDKIKVKKEGDKVYIEIWADHKGKRGVPEDVQKAELNYFDFKMACMGSKKKIEALTAAGQKNVWE